jgi:hypothetical protein
MFGTKLSRLSRLKTLIFVFAFLCFVVHYKARKRELNRPLIYECRCDESLKSKDEGSTRLTYTGLSGGLGTGTPKDRDEVNRREV